MTQTRGDGSLALLFRPNRIAIVGASQDERRYGAMLLAYALRSAGHLDVFPVNPKYEELHGVRCYATLDEVPARPDVVLILLDGPRTRTTLETAARLAVPYAIVFGKAIGLNRDEGIDLLRHLRRHNGPRVVGPNCVGIINARDGIALSIASVLKRTSITPGTVGVVSQSGGVLGAILDKGPEHGLGFSGAVSSGDELDLDTADFLEHFVADPATDVILAFLEGFRRPDRFRDVAHEARRRRKPLVVLKVGRTGRGAEAVHSHSGRLAGSYEVQRAVFDECGVVAVDTLDEMLAVAALLRGPRRRGRGVGVVSLSGGMASLVADRCADYGVVLPPFAPDVARDLAAVAGVERPLNPLDAGAHGPPDEGPRLVRRAIEAIARDPGIGMVVLAESMLLPVRELAEAVTAAARTTGMPMAAIWEIGPTGEQAVGHLRESGVPVFTRLQLGVRALAALDRWEAAVDRPKISVPQDMAPLDLPAASGPLAEDEAAELLAEWGIPVAPWIRVTTAEDATRAAQVLDGPVVLKALSSDLTHLTELGLILLDLRDADAVRTAHRELERRVAALAPRIRLRGYLVQRMVRHGVEMFAGARQDPEFGSMVMCGVGGSLVEVFRDVSVYPAPLTLADAERMIGQLRGAALLGEVRGHPPADVPALCRALVRLGQVMASSRGRIVELDINPLFVLERGRGVLAADALLVLGSAGAPTHSAISANEPRGKTSPTSPIGPERSELP
jgi:acetate---CoA ligase (ADP-forming)